MNKVSRRDLKKHLHSGNEATAQNFDESMSIEISYSKRTGGFVMYVNAKLETFNTFESMYNRLIQLCEKYQCSISI